MHECQCLMRVWLPVAQWQQPECPTSLPDSQRLRLPLEIIDCSCAVELCDWDIDQAGAVVLIMLPSRSGKLLPRRKHAFTNAQSKVAHEFVQYAQNGNLFK